MANSYVNTAVVLAGGKGTRLFPLTKSKPKPLISVCNYTMLEWNLFVLQKAGIENVIIVVKYLGEQIIEFNEYLKENFPSMNIQIPDVDPKDTADALREVAKYLPENCERFYVTMADIVTNINLTDMAEFHKQKQSMTTISLKSIDRPRSFGVIVLDKNSQILLFLEKPRPQELYMVTLMYKRKEAVQFYANLVNTGIYLFEKEILEILGNFPELMDFGRNLFPFLLERKMIIFGYSPPPGDDYYWMDCGTPEKLIWANYDVLKRWNWPYLPRGKEKDGSWWGNNTDFGNNLNIESPIAVGDNVSILDGVTIKKYTVIGDNCKIGQDTILNEPIIRDDVNIGSNCNIQSSFIAEKVNIGNNVIIEENVVIAKDLKISDGEKITAGSVLE
ncbi:MAG: Glucose-1-phosphate adenylyltransferase [Candidatus Heimdallarchaeota archaeon LC_3]|nr:MAG: Glucose-1-phosphate adenylyltransferase [Candidatus Heimdallarchaeota archaeon LC_3]